ncbi:hypothetical protein [Comamonas sp. E6]|uniref:hypothetical protein n=1 Tax=Comamonas sp. E6 TaxID=364029 RepID=UPI00062EDD7A|nr:hypothetical protein [Comamonas sp. E6]GAO71886.1 [protein-PII] uridylyltransferase [Comamonas sp. E6]
MSDELLEQLIEKTQELIDLTGGCYSMLETISAKITSLEDSAIGQADLFAAVEPIGQALDEVSRSLRRS